MRRYLVLPLALAALALLAVASRAFSHGVLAPGTRAPLESPDRQAAEQPLCCTRISEEEAHRLVWALPDVQRIAKVLRKQGVRPFTMTESEPGAKARPEEAAYVISLNEDHETHVARLKTFSVNACTGSVSG